MRHITTKFDSQKFNFHEAVGGVLIPLDSLHFLVQGKYKELFEVGADSSTVFHKAFYDKYREGWEQMEQLYYDFICDHIAPSLVEDFLYQKFPTFRVHLPGNIAVGRFHFDAEFGHPQGEINYIIPFTNSSDTGSVWIESEKGKGDFKAIDLNIGELVQFNGNQLTHGNKVNETGETRVSMDFRILPISMYNEGQIGESMTRKTKFIEGEYYKRYYK